MKKLIVLWAFFVPFCAYAQCNVLRKSTDKFSGETRIRTDASEPAIVIRTVKDGQSMYALHLTTPGELVGNREGASLLLADGSRFDWPGLTVHTEINSYHPRWDSPKTAWAVAPLDDQQLQKIRSSRVTDYKLYVYTWSLKEKFGVSLQKQIECLVNADPATVKEK